MAYKDLALGDDGDLHIGENGDFTMIDSIRQALQIKLRWFRGEWKYDTSRGMPYLDIILVKAPNLALIEKAVREQILQVDGILGVKSVSFEQDKENRELRCRFEALTASETIESEVRFRNVG